MAEPTNKCPKCRAQLKRRYIWHRREVVLECGDCGDIAEMSIRTLRELHQDALNSDDPAVAA